MNAARHAHVGGPIQSPADIFCDPAFYSHKHFKICYLYWEHMHAIACTCALAMGRETWLTWCSLPRDRDFDQ